MFAATDMTRTPTQNHENRDWVPNGRSVLKCVVKSPFSSSRYVSSCSKVDNVSEDIIAFTREGVGKSAINLVDLGMTPLMGYV
jgi:hypothetical protein